jgi:transposase
MNEASKNLNSNRSYESQGSLKTGKYHKGLFDEQSEGEVKSISFISENNRRATFKNPDPYKLYHFNKRLDEYLIGIRMEWVIVFREFIQSLDYTEIASRYKGGGNNPYHPAIMLGVILYCIMKNRFALRELEEMTKMDIGCQWIAGGLAIDFTTFSKFMTKHEDLLTDEFFEQITKKVLSVIGKKVFTISIDGTVIQAAASRYKSLKLEAAKAEAERAKAELEKNPDDEKSKKKVEHAEQVVETVKQRAEARRKKGLKAEETQVSPAEPEAVRQKMKDNSYAFAHTPSIAASEDRIIVAKDVHPTSETKPVPDMLEQSQRICDSTIKRGLVDGNYFNQKTFNEFVNRDIDVLCPEGKSGGSGEWVKKSNKQIPKNQFIYNEKNNTYECPEGKVLQQVKHSKPTKKTEECWLYQCKECDECPRKKECTKNSQGRTIKRLKGDEDKEIMREVMKNPKAKKIFSKRQGAVEPVFGEIRGMQGLRRFRRKGLKKVKMEFSLHAITHNIRRMFALIELTKILASRTLYFLFQFLALFTKITLQFSIAIKKLLTNIKSNPLNPTSNKTFMQNIKPT